MNETSTPHELAALAGSAIAVAKLDISRLEDALKPALELADAAHRSVMRASEAIGNRDGTGACHACLALMGISARTLRAANDSARFSRNAMDYPPQGPNT